MGLALNLLCLMVSVAGKLKDSAPPSPDQSWSPPDLPAHQAGLQNHRIELPSNIVIDPRKIYLLPDLIDIAQRLNPETKIAWQSEASISRSRSERGYLLPDFVGRSRYWVHSPLCSAPRTKIDRAAACGATPGRPDLSDVAPTYGETLRTIQRNRKSGSHLCFSGNGASTIPWGQTFYRPGLVGLCWAKMHWIFSGDSSDEACGDCRSFAIGTVETAARCALAAVDEKLTHASRSKTFHADRQRPKRPTLICRRMFKLTSVVKVAELLLLSGRIGQSIQHGEVGERRPERGLSPH
jgi:hypothetical protein